jgi:hypothetical protein
MATLWDFESENLWDFAMATLWDFESENLWDFAMGFWLVCLLVML